MHFICHQNQENGFPYLFRDQAIQPKRLMFHDLDVK